MCDMAGLDSYKSHLGLGREIVATTGLPNLCIHTGARVIISKVGGRQCPNLRTESNAEMNTSVHNTLLIV